MPFPPPLSPSLSLFLSFCSLLPLPLSLSRHTKLSWSHYFEEKWSADMEEEKEGGGGSLSHTQILLLLYQDHFSFSYCRNINDTAARTDTRARRRRRLTSEEVSERIFTPLLTVCGVYVQRERAHWQNRRSVRFTFYTKCLLPHK